TSAPPRACRTVSGSVTQPSNTSTLPRTAARLAGSPVLKLSSTRTSCPRATSASTRCEPMNPAPPVTRQVAITSSVVERRILAGGWLVVGGWWLVEGSSALSHQPPTTNHQPPSEATSHQPPITDHPPKPPATLRSTP